MATDSSKIDALNSSDSKSGDSDGKSSAKDDSKSSSSEKADAADTAKVEKVKVDSVTVKGVAEKGPFAKGSAVTVYGLDSAFNKTKKSFKGSVTDDKGNYVVSGITLESQYALVEVNGFFMNEVTGKVTTGAKTKLTALVDLSKGGTVKANVNVLTPLEMSRAVYLVQNEKYNVPAAKKRATREILSVFGFGVDSVAATELALSGEGDATNALFAASVALIGDLSLSKFNSRLLDFAESFAATGKMDDTLRAAIADNLSYMDSANVLAEIAKNVKSINSKATGLEDDLYEFWYKEYGLPACEDKNEKTQEKNANKLSDNYGAGYACTSKHWHKSTALDTELGLCIGDAEGSYKESKAKKYYTCKSGQWREITSVQYELKECTDDIAKDAEKKYKSVDDKKFFLCKDKQWEELNADEFELKDCVADKEKKVVTTKTENNYVCEGGAWREATKLEAEFGYCAKADSSKIADMDDGYFVCLADGWTEVNDTIGVLGFCTEQNEMKKHSKTGESFVCNEGNWRGATDQEAEFGMCLKEDSTKIETLNDKYYVCLKGGWTEVNDTIGELGFCTKQNELKQNSAEKSFVCDGGNWRGATDLEAEFGVCVTADSTKFEKLGDAYYVCLGKDWTEVSDTIGVLGYCTTKNKYSLKKNTLTNAYFVCENKKWRGATNVELELGVCTEDDGINYVQSNTGKFYSCSAYKWTEIDEVTFKLKKICKGSQMDKKREKASDGTFYRCYDGTGWTQISELEYKNGVCIDDLAKGSIIENGAYVCSSSGWIGDCKKENRYKIIGETVCDVSSQDKTKYLWRSLSSVEKNISVGNQSFEWIDNVPYRGYANDDKKVYAVKFEYETVTVAGQSYKIIDINGMIWMAENLNNGNGLSCIRDDCSKYGTAYTKEEASTICTSVGPGWHLPAVDECDSLKSFTGVSSGGKSSFDEWSGCSSLAGARFNSSGFSALPTTDSKKYAYFWTRSVTEKNGYDIYMRMECDRMSTNSAGVTADEDDRLYAVRCVKYNIY